MISSKSRNRIPQNCRERDRGREREREKHKKYLPIARSIEVGTKGKMRLFRFTSSLVYCFLLLLFVFFAGLQSHLLVSAAGTAGNTSKSCERSERTDRTNEEVQKERERMLFDLFD